MLRRGSAVLPAAIAAAVLLAYVVLWLGAGAAQIGRSDFTSTYVGATLLREGQGGSMYDETLQAPLHAALIAPDREGNLPFVNAPLAAAVALPVSYTHLPRTSSGSASWRTEMERGCRRTVAARDRP